MHYIHYITCIIYDMSSTVYDITFTICVTSCMCDTHYICEYMSTIFDMKHNVLRQYNHYIWHHTLHVCVCVITATLSMIKHSLYFWHHIYCIYGTICTVYDISTMIHNIKTLYSWHQSYYISPHTDYIWQYIHCMSVITPRLSIIKPKLYVW